MEERVTIKFGEHRGKTANEIPMDYLVWLFPKLFKRKDQTELCHSILEYFLSKDVRVEDGKFYFNDYKNADVHGNEEPFLITKVIKNSKGENIYMIKESVKPIFIEEENNRFRKASTYSVVPYQSSGKLIVEFNKEYYFKDNRGLFLIGAYLIEACSIPKDLGVEFSENLKTESIRENEMSEK
jgi:hypothetical protein